MKLLFVGDIMGSGGRDIFLRVAREWKQSGKADFIVVNGEKFATHLTPAGATFLNPQRVDLLQKPAGN